MSNALTTIENIQDLEKMGHAMVASGFFSDVKQVSQAMVKIQAGMELGLPPFQSMTNIHVIKGKATLSAGFMATLVKRHPSYNYRIKESSNEACVIAFMEDGEFVGEVSFTMDDARLAGLLNNPTWKKYPSDMLFARAMSRGARRFCPDIFGGSVYTPEELEPVQSVRVVRRPTDNDGAVIEPEMIEAEVVEDGAGFDGLRSASEDLKTKGEPVAPSPAEITWGEWKDSLDSGEKSAGAGRWDNALANIPRYANSLHQGRNAAKKLIEGGFNNTHLVLSSGLTDDEKRTVVKTRVGLFNALRMYAEFRTVGMEYVDILEAMGEVFFDGDMSVLLMSATTESTGTQPALIGEVETAQQNAQLI